MPYTSKDFMAKERDELKGLKGLSEAGLQARLNELRDKIRDLSFRTHADEIRDIHQLRKSRRQVARILTLLREKTTISRRES